MSRIPTPKPPAAVLTEAELFDADGHASETALLLVADGREPGLGERLDGHLVGCQQCSERLADVMLLSAEFDEPVAQEALTRAAATSSGVVPWRALAVAAVLAVVGALPSAFDVPAVAARTALWAWSMLPKAVGATLVALRVLGNEGAPFLSAAQTVSVVVLVLIGVVIAARARRSSPKEAPGHANP